MRTYRAGQKEAGFTFAEVAFSMLILVIGAAVLINHLAVNYQATKTERDKVFAYAKAQAILAEIQNLVDRGGVDSAVDLDVLDDGVVSKNTLTITEDGSGNLVLPDHVLSGNYQRYENWIWSRRISVQPFSGVDNRNVRYVTVTIFRRDQDGNETAMADLSSVINSAAVAYPTTQVFDVYLLAVENIPGWWVYMDTIKPFVESMITDLESRNPGLEYRTHWITKAAFGRNQGYRPFINDAVDSYDPIADVYHYPGTMPSGSSSVYYYVPDNFNGYVNLDGVATNGYDATDNPVPYALADFFNHAMRYPDELELWERRVAAIEQREADIAAAILAGTTPPDELDDMSKEPTLRLFLEDLNTDPDKYRNALVINLHGELLPMPALRNYSDAARVPDVLPNIRAVTHPEQLRTLRDPVTPSSSDVVSLRVYAYHDDPSYSGDDRIWYDPGAGKNNYIVLEIPGLDIVDNSTYELDPSARLFNVHGGVPWGFAGTTDYDLNWQPAVHFDDPAREPGQMWYFAYLAVDPEGGPPVSRILLGNTPVICPLDSNNRGLAATDRAMPYGMPYVPCSIETSPAFDTDLTTIGAVGPKNTARWNLQISPDVLTNSSFVNQSGVYYNPPGDVQLEVRTYIYAGSYGPGVMWPAASRVQPDNKSKTYTWWADSAEDVPFTERSQFNGDPRHMPYVDCMTGATDFPDGYNWYFNDLAAGGNDAAPDFPSIDDARLRDRWNGSMSCDVPRYMQLLRRGLARSSCVYTTLTGYSYYYLGIGNDIGYDSANGYPSSIPLNMTPHGGTGNGYLNTITSSRRYVRSNDATPWWGMPWLGELYPDSAQATWFAEDGSGNMRGNLDPGTSAGEFFQTPVATAYDLGTRTSYGIDIVSNHQRTSSRGCICFFNIGSGGSTFDHVPSGGNGSTTTIGTEVATNYNIELVTTAPISRPFRLNDNAWPADEWNYSPYTSRNTASLYKEYFTHGSGVGSGLVKLVDNAGTDAAYIVVNGIDKTVQSGTSFIAKWSVLTLTHSFFEAGDTANTLRINQLPRVEINYPNDITELVSVTSIDVVYDVEWTRWDGEPYTLTGTFSEDESLLEYVIMYSRDNGDTWLHVQDNAVATPGERPTNATYLEPDVSVGEETYTWPTPASNFPEGTYLLRIDCYRQGAQVHYAYHQTKIYIQR